MKKIFPKFTRAALLLSLLTLFSTIASTCPDKTQEKQGSSQPEKEISTLCPQNHSIEDNTRNLHEDNKLPELEARIRNLESNSSSTDFAMWTGILLACVTVILTTLGVIIAILSFIGYNTALKKAESLASEKATQTAAKTARDEIRDRIDDGSFNDLIEEAVDKVAFKGIASFSGDDYEEENTGE